AVAWVDVKVGDLNGDGKADIIGRIQTNGQWWAGLSTGAAFSTVNWGAVWAAVPGVTWVDVQLADLNGDGKADLVGRFKETGQWWASLSAGTVTAGTSLWDTWA